MRNRPDKPREQLQHWKWKIRSCNLMVSRHAKQVMFPGPVTQISQWKKRLRKSTISSPPLCWEAPDHLTKVSKSQLKSVWVRPITKSQCQGMLHSATRWLLISRCSESCDLFKENPWRFKNPRSIDRSFKTEETLTCLYLVREPRKPGFVLCYIRS